MIGEYNFTLLALVFMRMSGCILFNPVFGRKNVPTMLKIGMTIFLTIFTYTALPPQTVEINNAVVLGVMAAKELLIGLAVGYIMQMFMAVILLGGEVIDLQIGISMAKIYDPQSNVSMPMSGSILNAMWMLIFFASGSHVTMMSIFCQLGIVQPYGSLDFASGFFKEMAALFSLILIYAVKMSLPILAVAMITEISVGLLMKAVPQINVFVINIQLKILVGFGMILALIPMFSRFMQRLIELMFDQISRVAGALG